MTPKERAAMQQALEALERWKEWDERTQQEMHDDIDDAAITALREALAEQSTRNALDSWEKNCNTLVNNNKKLKEQLKQMEEMKNTNYRYTPHEQRIAEQAEQEQEPVVWMQQVLDATSCDVKVITPIRDYESMSPLDCYEAGIMDGGTMVRKTIQDKVKSVLNFYSEPVAWGHPNTAITGRKQALMMVELEIPSNAQYPQMWVPLYAAPVRTKDLTDDEIIRLMRKFPTELSFNAARAVIQEFRNKNGLI